MFSGHWTHLNDFWVFWSLGTLEWLLKDDWHTQWLVLSDGHWCGHVYFVNTGPVLPWHLEVSTKNHCQQLGLMGWHQVNKETAKKYKMPYWSQQGFAGQHQNIKFDLFMAPWKISTSKELYILINYSFFDFSNTHEIVGHNIDFQEKFKLHLLVV